MRAEHRRVAALERLLHLRRVPLIGSLPPADLSVMADYARERFFAKGERALRAGQPVDAVYVVIEGMLGVARDGRYLGGALPGSGVGGLGLVARDTAGIDAVAEEDTLTLELDRDSILEMLEDHFPILRHMIRETCRLFISSWRRYPHDIKSIPRSPSALTSTDKDLDLIDRIVFFRQTPHFARGSLNALAELSRGLVEMHIEEGTVLWREGEVGQTALLLVAGEIHCSSKKTGVDFHVRPGAATGILDALAGVPRWHDAVTTSRVVAMGGDIEGMYDVFEDNFEMAADYLAVVARWLLDLIERVDDAAAVRRFFGAADDTVAPLAPALAPIPV
jgi:CRP-like cAMP-binding protein